MHYQMLNPATTLDRTLSESFVQSFTRTQRSLYVFILTQTGSTADADDVLQEVNLVILSKAEQFQEGTSFWAWARQIAHFEVLKFRKSRRQDKLRFSEDFVDTIARESEARSPQVEARRLALEHCLNKLRERDRELIHLRYRPGHSGKEAAEQLGRPYNAVYQSLMRIRRTLWECTQRRLAEDHT